MIGSFVRRMRIVVVPIGIALLGSCRWTETTAAPQRKSNGVAEKTLSAVANAGCSLGLSEGANAARVSVISRNRLPFKLPEIAAATISKGPLRMHVIHVTVPAGGARAGAMLACMVLANGDYAKRTLANVREAGDSDWAELAHEVETSGVMVAQDIYRAVGNILLDSTFRVAPAGQYSTASRAMWPSTNTLPVVQVIASAPVVVINTYIAEQLFKMSPQNVIITWDMIIAQQEWSEACDEWNAAMDEYEATKDAVAAAADEEANELEDLAFQLEVAVAPLETAEASCKPTNGKKMCIDFFIMNCWLGPDGGSMLGDCRGFDRNADYANSRVQFYIDPDTKAWEVKYSCTRILIPFPVPGIPIPFCDSAAVYNPATDTRIFPPDAEGFTRIEMTFYNNACKYVGESLCPAIDAVVKFKANPAAPAGYEIRWVRDGFPSMGVYIRNASNTDWLVAEEDAQKTKWGVQAIRALAGQIRSQGYNYPPPGGQPEGCFRQ